jgi:type I restriction enzyme S subunit
MGPPLRSPWIPKVAVKNRWTRVAFGDVVKLSGERSTDPEEEGFERYVGLDHIDPGDLKIRRWGNIADGTTFTSVFRPGHVLFGKRRAYQRKVAVADFSGVCSGDIYVFEAKSSRLDPELLPFICQTTEFFDHAIGTSAGSLSPRTNWNSLASYVFSLPPLHEQPGIVEMLMAGTKVIEAFRWLVRSGDFAMKSAIAAFDESCMTSSLQMLMEVADRLESGRSPSGLARPAGLGEYGVLKVSAVGDWSFVERENKRVPPGTFDHRLEVKPGDLLVTRANADPNSVGRTCLVEACSPGLMISDKTWRLVLKHDRKVDPVGVLAWTKSPRFRRHVRNQLGGTDAKNISKAQFLAAPFPPLDTDAFSTFSAQVRTLRSGQIEVQRRLDSSIALVRKVRSRTLEP